MDGERNRLVSERAHVEDHCRATRNTCGLEGNIPAAMVVEHLSTSHRVTLGHHLFQ